MSNRDACLFHALALEHDGEGAEQSRGAGTFRDRKTGACISQRSCSPQHAAPFRSTGNGAVVADFLK